MSWEARDTGTRSEDIGHRDKAQHSAPTSGSVSPPSAKALVLTRPPPPPRWHLPLGPGPLWQQRPAGAFSGHECGQGTLGGLDEFPHKTSALLPSVSRTFSGGDHSRENSCTCPTGPSWLSGIKALIGSTSPSWLVLSPACMSTETWGTWVAQSVKCRLRLRS